MSCAGHSLRGILCVGIALTLIGVCPAADTSEFRRALLIGNQSAALESALKQRGFLISRGTIAEFLPGIPHHGFNLIYYRGDIEIRDGKWHLSSEQVASQELITHIQNRNVARHNVLVFDLQNTDIESHTALRGALQGIAGRNNSGNLAVVNKSAAAEHALADQITAWLRDPKTDLRDALAATALVSAKTGEPVELRGVAAQSVSDPDQVTSGRHAGDQWLAPDGMNFVWCPPGAYQMGDAQFYDAQPLPIVIQRGFWISKFEMTRLDCDRFQCGSAFFSGRQPMQPGHGNFLERLVETLATKPDMQGWSYDLPSEAEWEYAARAGSQSNLPSPIEHFANFADRSLYNAREHVHFIFAHRTVDDGYAHAFANIGRFQPNAWGIHDMFGNVSEFCAGYYAEQLTGQVDYHLKTARDRRTAILRGGAWCTPLKNLHVAFRTAFNGDQTQPYAGARLLIRKGQRVSRTYKELVAAKKAQEASARGQK
jgi:formylglycine-generating enzyme required for sulfatase activity